MNTVEKMAHWSVSAISPGQDGNDSCDGFDRDSCGETRMNRTGFYCEDCDRIMDASNYGDHNADHTLKAIVWDFLGDPKVVERKSE